MKTLWKQPQKQLSSAQIIPLAFLSLIAIGTVLLMLPFATVSGKRTSILTALFTATTSVCVTGLVVVDTYAHWTLFGKIVIFALIQLGGIGVIAVSSTFLLLFGRNFSIKDRVVLRDSFNLDSISGLVPFLLWIIRSVFLTEAVGALLYAFVFVPQYGWGTGLWYSVFHAVSAFCNAGIDILGPDSLLPYANNSWILFVTMLLIVLGGLGFIVWLDLSRHMRERIQNRKTPSRLSEHTKLVLWLTAGLIFSGAAMILLFEWSNPQTIGSMPIRQKVLHSLFQSVTFRTAGFAAIPQAGLTDSSVLLGCIYMFIGGSPMGTAGGVKTVTFFLLVASAHSYIRNRSETVLLRRRVSEVLIRKSAAIIGFSLIVTLIMSAALLAADGIPMADGMFEVFSATATVGLSRGITSTLSPLGRILIIICMYLGRIGPISIALFFESSEGSENGIKHANGRYFVG